MAAQNIVAPDWCSVLVRRLNTNDKNVATPDWCAVKVINVSLSTEMFNELADLLQTKESHGYDYRLISDFDILKTPMYWMSNSWSVNDANFIDVMRHCITRRCMDFLKENKEAEDAVKIELINLYREV